MANPESKNQLATLLVILTEVMFFGGLLSAYWVLRAQIQPWPPIGQPRFPVGLTAWNTGLLLLSGWLYWKGQKSLLAGNKKYWAYILLAALGGACFVLIQGVEWWRLLQFGMYATENVYGGIFYLIVGSHAFHVLVALGVILYLLWGISRGKYSKENASPLLSGGYFWFFVVALWPVLYVALYLI